MYNRGILSALFIGTVATIVLVQSQQSIYSVEINQIVKAITVKIEGAGRGTGFIINREGNTYTVLTNWHVVKNQGDHNLTTIDGQTHKITGITEIVGVDAAIVNFTSNKTYSVAALGNSDQLQEGQTIHYGGYPDSDQVAQNRTYNFYRAENLIGFVSPSDIQEGYELIVSGAALPGMSGSPIINDNGQVIGIYGRATVNGNTGQARLFGIPINSVVKFAARYNIALNKSGSSSVSNPSPSPSVARTPLPTPSPSIAKVLPANYILDKTLTGHSQMVDSVAISGDSKRLVSGSRDKTIKV